MKQRADRLAEILAGFGIEGHDTVLFEAPGWGLEGPGGGPAGLFSALYSVLDPSGTLVVPTCTAEEGRPKPTFDPLLSPSEAGPFSEYFRSLPGVLRSHSPTHSVAAYGPAAREIIAGHRTATGRPTPWGDGPFGHGSPWDVLVQRDAWWVMVDATWDESPFTTYVKALYVERHLGLTKETPFPEFSGAALARLLEDAGILRHADWDGLPVTIFRAREACSAALDALETAPERTEPSEGWRLWLAAVADIRRHGYLQVGTARAVITPALPVSRWDGKQLTGLYRDLYARVLFLQRGEQRLALVVCDLLGIAKDLTDAVRQAVEARIGLPASHLMLACTHSHATPDTIGAGNASPEYSRDLVSRITDAVCDAAGRLQPVRIGWGRVPIRGLAHSRRVKMIDGSVFTTRYGVPSTWRVRPELIAGQGPMDPDLTVVRIETLDGEVLAVLSNFGIHASVALMSTNVSGDLPGEAMHVLENALGGEATVLFTNGSAGDIDPTAEMPYWGPRNDTNARHLGRIFAAQVLECLERVRAGDEASIAAAQQAVELPVRPDWVHMVAEEQARLAQEFAAVSVENEVVSRVLRERAIRTEVQAIRLNDLVLVGLPGEVLTGTGMKIKGRVPHGRASVVELANDYVGYILTPEAQAEGGYEAGLHLWTRVCAEAEDILLSATDRLIHQLLAREPSGGDQHGDK